MAGSTGKCANFSTSPFSIISASRFGSVMGAIYIGLNTLWRTGVKNLKHTNYLNHSSYIASHGWIDCVTILIFERTVYNIYNDLGLFNL